MDYDDQVEQATSFRVSDVPNEQRPDGIESKREHYTRLQLSNRLRWNGKWRDEERETVYNQRAVVESVASSLSLTDFQTRKALRYLEETAESRVTAYNTSLVALCVCGLAGRDDGRDYHPNLLNSSGDPASPDVAAFLKLTEKFDVSHSELYSCWLKVKGDIE